MTKILTGSLVIYKNRISFLEAVLNSLPKENFVLVVVDNSPTDSLRPLFSGKNNIDYIFLNSNLGFGIGHNIAFKKVKNISEFHFIINPDVYCNADVFTNIASFMQTNSNIGIVGPKILYPNNDVQYSCRLLPTPVDLILRRLPSEFVKARNSFINELRFTNYNKIMEVPFLLGCFLCCRVDVFEQIGGFDERYFMYLEDVDICRTVYKTHKVVFYPEVSVYHHYAKDSKTNLRLFLAHLKSSFKYFNKWGWFFDKERNGTNKQVLKYLRYKSVE